MTTTRMYCTLLFLLLSILSFHRTHAQLQVGYSIPNLPSGIQIANEIRALAQVQTTLDPQNVTDANVWTVYVGQNPRAVLQGRLLAFNGSTSKIPQDGSNWIAWVNCDFNTSISVDGDVFSLADENNAVGIVMYSLNSTSCNTTGTDLLSISIYATVDHSAARRINNLVLAPPVNTSVHGLVIPAGSMALPNGTVPSPSTPTGSAPLPSVTTTDNSGSGTGTNTSLAMNILYGITGCVSFLFLMVILSGAVRAIRHPERYGPRARNPHLAGRAGQAQSRAGGIARAMLESFPITRFTISERERDIETAATPKPETIEMKDAKSAAPILGDQANLRSQNVEDVDAIQPLQEPKDKNVVPASFEMTEADNRSSRGLSRPTAAPGVSVDNQTTCPICVDDFEGGEELRVLPCKHQYHPACIDPWLLNHSTICPLCRYDFSLMANASNFAYDAPEDVSVPVAEEEFPESRFQRYLSNVRSRLSRSGTTGSRSAARMRGLRRFRSRHDNDPMD